MSHQDHTDLDHPGEAVIWRRDLVRVRFEWYDFAVCTLFFLLAGWFLNHAGVLAELSDEAFGPATFPTAISILLILTTAIVFLRSAINLYRGKMEKPVEIRRPIFVLLGCLLIIAFVVAMGKIGFYPTATVWVVLFGYMAGVRKPAQLGGLAVGFLAFAWLIFEKLLGTPLP